MIFKDLYAHKIKLGTWERRLRRLHEPETATERNYLFIVCAILVLDFFFIIISPAWFPYTFVYTGWFRLAVSFKITYGMKKSRADVLYYNRIVILLLFAH